MNAPNISKAESPAMFNAIAGRYDFLNRLLSLGQDVHWRRQLRKHVPHGEGVRLLDLACGTGDVLITLLKDNPSIVQAIGIDPAANMLAIGRRKIQDQGLADRVVLQIGDAQKLPFLDDSFDCVTISFGIRNIPDLRLALLEMYRVTRKGGRLLVLEFSSPANPFMAAGHFVYLNTFVPLMGFLFSGNAAAYRYLSKTIQAFPYGERFCRILMQFGFTRIQANELMGGVATIYVAEK